MSKPATPAPSKNRAHFRQLSVLIGVSAVDMIGFAIVLPLLPFYALNFKATPVQIGWLMAAFSIAQLLSSPLWGRFSDRYGRRPALLVGLSASALAYIVFGLANSLAVLFLSRLVQGAGGGTTGVIHAYVADTMKPADRARALGWLSAATSAGVAIGPTLGSWFNLWLGPRAPGFAAAIFCLVNVFFAWKWLPESKPKAAAVEGPVKPKPPIWHTAWIVVSHPRGTVSRLIWIYAVGMLAFTCMTAVVALYLNAEFDVTEKTIGYFFTYIGILSFVMRSVFLGPVVDRVGETWAMRIGAGLLVIGFILYPLVPTVWLLVLVIPLVPIGTALLFPSTTSLMTRASEKSEVGTTMGTAQFFAGIARVAAPLAATYAFQSYGHRSPFFLGGRAGGAGQPAGFSNQHQPSQATPLPVRDG